MANTNLWQYTDEEYNKLNDEEIVKLAKAGEKSALDFIINKYKNVVNIKVSKYFIIGAEKEDIVQEGLIGLYKAVKSFDQEKENSFKTFANLCIERQLITAIKSSNRQKHMPLNSYLSLNMSAYEDDETDSVMDVFDSNTIEDPLDTITKKEYYSEIESAIDKSLSDFEKKVLNRFAKGETYVQIADKLNTPVKSVDNAIQRIRKKAIRNIVDE
jgi:RNA polymerase sporulation-specific sigma factor